MEPGDLIAERYRLVALVGRGAMGVVWRAQDEQLDRVVAVKELLLDTSADDERTAEAVARAMREGRIAGRLRHPNAVSVHEVVEHEGRPCLVMEYLEAQSLGAMIATRGPLPADEVAAIGVQVADALAEAHAAGIVHRDVKPDNVLITADGTAKITDFGVSRAAGDATVTATGFVAGTPAYLAPEVATGQDGDARSDVFSLGSTLYHALEGDPPFGMDDNAIAMLHKVAAGEVRPPQRSGELAGLVMWLLQVDPAERPTMRGVYHALTAAAHGQPLPEYHPRPQTLVLPTARRMSRRTVVAGLAATALVAAGVVVGVLISGSPTDATGARGTPPATGGPTSAPPPSDERCSARFAVKEDWDGGYNAEVRIRNVGTDKITGWTVRWTMPEGHELNDVWTGDESRDGRTITVTNLDWNALIDPGTSIGVGMGVNADNAKREKPAVECIAD
jgi:Protein kinase domain/Cellulose binding domain